MADHTDGLEILRVEGLGSSGLSSTKNDGTRAPTIGIIVGLALITGTTGITRRGRKRIRDSACAI